MPQSTLAIQLYTLRDHLKTPKEIAATLKCVKKIGYTAVELAGLGKIEPDELANILSGEGIVCCGGHVPLESLIANPQKVIEDHRLWGCPQIAIPGYWGKNAADFAGFTAKFNALANTLADSGIRLGYHNHSHELVKHHRRTILATFIEQFDPRLWFEIDTYWIAHGGGDPIQWIGKVKGRIPCVHLKDMAIDEAGKQHMAEVGEGNLNFFGIIAACREAGVRWHVVEQDICQRDPLESIAISLNNLHEMGIE
jgi:sugar phosphate isomerase/epimerase